MNINIEIEKDKNKTKYLLTSITDVYKRTKSNTNTQTIK